MEVMSSEEVTNRNETIRNSLLNMSSLGEVSEDDEYQTPKKKVPVIAEVKIPACKNLGFNHLVPMFMQKGWYLMINTETAITFQKGDGCNMYIEIFINKNDIEVTVPLLNSSYQYRTSFKSYFEASEYIEMQLNHVSEPTTRCFY